MKSSSPVRVTKTDTSAIKKKKAPNKQAKEVRDREKYCLVLMRPASSWETGWYQGLRKSQKPQDGCQLITAQKSICKLCEVARVDVLWPGHPPAGRGVLPPCTGDSNDVCMRSTWVGSLWGYVLGAPLVPCLWLVETASGCMWKPLSLSGKTKM